MIVTTRKGRNSGADLMGFRQFAIVMAAVCGTSTAFAVEHARITLDVAAPGGQVTAYVDQTPPESGKIPRPVLKAKVGEPIKVKYLLTNVDPHKILPDVVVHFFIVKEEKVGQKEIPPLGDDVVLETAFDLDFRPGGKSGARTTFRIDTPGAYLIRVETRETKSDHEHFSAVDLVIEGEKP